MTQTDLIISDQSSFQEGRLSWSQFKKRIIKLRKTFLWVGGLGPMKTGRIMAKRT
jgi:hypothetical protein